MAKEFKLPELGENVSSGTVAKLLVEVGDRIEANQTVLEVETDKAVAEIPCPFAGVVKEIRVSEGKSVSAGDVVLLIEEGAPSEAKAPAAPKAEKKAEAPSEAKVTAPASKPAAEKARPAGAAVLASPSVRRLARELGVNLDEVPTSDPSGRVTAQDVQKYAEGSKRAPAPKASPSSPGAVSGGDFETGQDAFGPVVFEPMNAIRRKTMDHMTHCWSTIPHVTHFDEADITDLEALRLKRAKKIESGGGRLTTICFIIKVVAEGLKRFPRFNASLDADNQRVVLRQYYNIGIAVDTPNGLLVPVLRDADRMSIADLAEALPRISQRARERKLGLEEMQGGTFTITNLGGLGGTGFTPIINAPEVAILGVSRARVMPVYREGELARRTMLPLSLSYDHRVIDGADAARFTRWLSEALEEAWNILI
jgi:pyruvate dehydrogenase E2 component (dihydrolipoamide acetyltransferase)